MRPSTAIGCRPLAPSRYHLARRPGARGTVVSTGAGEPRSMKNREVCDSRTSEYPMRGTPFPSELSSRALATPEPFVRMFARRVQQEGALDLTQGDYKNADFAPHPEVVRAAQRITRNTVHSYGPAVGRMDVRSEVAEFFNRDGMLDYPGTEVRFLPDEVLFTPGTRPGSPSCSRCSAPTGRASWSRGRAGSTTGSSSAPARSWSSCRRRRPTSCPTRRPRPAAGRGGISSRHPQQPHNPTGRVYPRELVEELVRSR